MSADVRPFPKLLIDRRKRQPQDSPLVQKVRELERLSPAHALALGVMADGIFERLRAARRRRMI
jgi:hypothetical protein